MSAKATSIRLDYIHENDVALGRLLDYLEKTDDPRNKGSKLIENTIVIFTSDNGAEITAKTATGPVRSNKGSCYEGSHRVPFIVSWPKGIAKGKVSEQLIGLQDLYATFSEIMGVSLPDLKKRRKGSRGQPEPPASLAGEKLVDRPMFYNDHKESKDGAASAMRLDDPKVGGTIIRGKWKLFFDASLLRSGTARPTALFDLASDPKEEKNRLDDPSLKRLVKKLVSTALLHRRVGGHRFVPLTPKKRVIFDWTQPIPSPAPMVMNLLAKGGKASMDSDGVGIPGSGSDRVDAGQGIALRFQQDVLIESIGLKAGKDGSCGGSLIMGKRSPLAIYCTDKDNDAKDQQGIMSDLGILKKGKCFGWKPAPTSGWNPRVVGNSKLLSFDPSAKSKFISHAQAIYENTIPCSSLPFPLLPAPGGCEKAKRPFHCRGRPLLRFGLLWRSGGQDPAFGQVGGLGRLLSQGLQSIASLQPDPGLGDDRTPS